VKAVILRLFVALELPSFLRGQVAALLGGDIGVEGRVRWVREENLHLTLKFIGGVEESRLRAVESEIEKAVSRVPPFEARLGGCGVFPGPTKGRVIWLGMEEGRESAGKLAARLDSRLSRVGVKREARPFRGHLTLARIKPPSDCTVWLKEAEEKLRGLSLPPFQVREVVLFRSILHAEGPEYVPLKRFALGGKEK
jgi:2'-5' RNA ligase